MLKTPFLKRPMLHFFLLGALFWLGENCWLSFFPQANKIIISTERVAKLTHQWQLETGRKPTQIELEGLISGYIEEEVLVQEAITQHVVEMDPIIRARLEKNLEFVDMPAEKTAVPLWQQAIAMGMHQQDPVVRRRLIQVMEGQIRKQFSPSTPTESELMAFVAKHQQRYTPETLVSFRQLFFENRSAKGDGKKRANDTLQQLKKQTGENQLLINMNQLSDAALFPLEFNRVTEKYVSRYLGESFTQTLGSLPQQRWSDPIESPYGWHLVYYEGSTAVELPKFETVKTAALQDWRAEQTNKRLSEYKQEMVKKFAIDYQYLMDFAGSKLKADTK